MQTSFQSISYIKLSPKIYLLYKDPYRDVLFYNEIICIQILTYQSSQYSTTSPIALQL